MKPTLEIKPTGRYRKDLKRAKKRGLDLEKLKYVVKLLAAQEPLPEKYLDHPLSGNWKDFRECHVEPNWLLIYAVHESTLILVLAATGTHADLFDE